MHAVPPWLRSRLADLWRSGNRDGAGLEVFVEAPARLHFGVLDLRGELGRWFGGIGAAAPGSDAARICVQGPDRHCARPRRAAGLGVREAVSRPPSHPRRRPRLRAPGAAAARRSRFRHTARAVGGACAGRAVRARHRSAGAGAGRRPRRRSAIGTGSFPAAAWSSRAAGTPGSTTAGR